MRLLFSAATLLVATSAAVTPPTQPVASRAARPSVVVPSEMHSVDDHKLGWGPTVTRPVARMTELRGALGSEQVTTVQVEFAGADRISPLTQFTGEPVPVVGGLATVRADLQRVPDLR